MHYAHPGEVLDEVAQVTPSYGGLSFSRLEAGGLQWPCPNAEHPGTPILHVGKFTRGLGRFLPATYRPPAETPDADYPLVLSTGRNYWHFHTGTMTRRTRLLEREERFPYVEVNAQDAQRLGIRDRAWVLVRTRRGEVRARAHVTADIREGVLFMPFHYEEGAANVLTNNALDPEAKIPEYKVCAAAIRPAS
jgi:formate dehydrogenase major subunit/formate dehydrogenase alpha subunit